MDDYANKDAEACLRQYLRGLGAQLQPEGLNILGASDGFQEFLTLRAIAGHHDEVSGKGVFVVLLPRQRDLAHWDSLIECNFGGKIKTARMPETHYWGGHRYGNQSVQTHHRLRTLTSLALHEGYLVVLATLAGAMQRGLGIEGLRERCLSVGVGQDWDQDVLVTELEDLGYAEAEAVAEPGQYCRRGGILDLFSYSSPLPYRMEFLGDRVHSIRSFDPADQRSKEGIQDFRVSLAQELDYRQKDVGELGQTLHSYLIAAGNVDQYERQGLVDSLRKGYKFPSLPLFYPILNPSSPSRSLSLAGQLPAGTPVLLQGSLHRLKEAHEQFLGALGVDYESDLSSGKATVDPELHFEALPPEVERTLVEFANPYRPGVSARNGLPPGVKFDFDRSLKLIKDYLSQDIQVFVLIHDQAQLQRISGVLDGHHIPWNRLEEPVFAVMDRHLQRDAVQIAFGELSEPVLVEMTGQVLIPAHSFFGEQRKRHISANKRLKNVFSSFKELSEGSLVVHQDHGVGRYLGLESLSVSGLSSDFLLIEYDGGDRIYLPVDKLDRLQKFSSGGHAEGRLDKLKSQAWQKKQSRAKKAARDMAEELLSLQAKRKTAPGTAFSPPGDLYYQFEADFPFQETEDQLRCIDEVGQDLSASHPMDRLICGDVGFGKTEIALRAAMRVVVDGYQVMILAPTTVLSFQHYRTFSKRFEKFGIVIGLLNRFQKGRQAKETIEMFAQGRIDILVGTHRVLQKQVKPKKLGLIVVDEEQKFGVAHKERLKSLKVSCDILTMTATPIPRSLHMSLLGLRDISVLMTPPRERSEVKTFVMEWDQDLLRSAIEREVFRGGQVFFVHNRVGDILEVKSQLSDMLPGIDVRVAHGQMTEQSLESLVVDFLDQKFPVMLCTTIIESGIDMPNVNTIIVNQADKFGLAQLYQLRGRVGRSSRQSYAYFVTRSMSSVSVEAEQRLQVLAAHQELGAGFFIANYDLEFRGAGDLLGSSQSGHARDVGIELYTQMLEEEVLKARGMLAEETARDPEIKLDIQASLPASYIPAEAQRLAIYKRVFSADTQAEIEDIQQELEDRYGAIADEARLIFEVAKLKLLLKSFGVTSLSDLGHERYELRLGSLSEKNLFRIEEAKRQRPDLFMTDAEYSLVVSPAGLDQDGNSPISKLIYGLEILGTY